MRLPRDVSSRELGKALAKLGYVSTRQRGSHARHTTQIHGEHHITIPGHNPISSGTLRGILRAVAAHHGISMDELLNELDL